MNMNILSLNEYLKRLNEFIPIYNSYISIKECVETSKTIDKNEKEQLIEMLDVRFSGYTKMEDFPYYTEMDEEYIRKNPFAEHYKEKLKHVGEECDCVGVKGTFLGILATITGFLYKIEKNGNIELQPTRLGIKFPENPEAPTEIVVNGITYVKKSEIPF